MSNSTAIEAMKSRARGILVADLKAVCRDEGLAVSGAKQVLQHRIITRIDQMVNTGNALGLASMRSSLSMRGGGPLPALDTNSASSTSRNFGSSTNMGYTNGVGGIQRHTSTGVQFRPSPFFELLEPLARPVDLPPFPNHRNQVPITFQLQPQNIERLRSDSSLRILLYCAAKGDTVNGHQSDVAFPSQLEVKVNDSEVRANFKGLKNKAGSTRPADITAFITKQPGFTNRILTTYALTQKVGEKPSLKVAQGFVMVAMLVKKRSVDELVERISKGKVITREKVLHEMAMRANDPDIVVGSSVMSLKDPVSYMRISVPCRSDICSHHQCFDAASFLQLQEQAPTWTCPICNKVVSFEGLVVDQYFEDILRRTSSSTYQITVQPDGQWAASAAEKPSGRNGVKSESSDEYSDDDLVEVVKPVKRESMGSNVTPVTPYSMVAPTPPRASPIVNSATGSVASAPRHGQKRKSEVIDLTLSDDDEPAPKRPAYNTPNSLPDYGQRGRPNGYQSYPNNPPSFSNRANGPLRFQIGNGSQSGSGGSGGGGGVSSNNINDQNYDAYSSHHDYSNSNESNGNNIFGNPNIAFPPSRSGHRPSPLSGSALAPINLTESPPNRPPSALAPYSAGSGYGLDQRRPPDPPTLPRLDFDGFQSPPPIPPSAIHTRAANSSFRPGQQSEQRAMLRQLANPFRDDRQ